MEKIQSRRDFLKASSTILGSAMVYSSLANEAARYHTQHRPNVVFSICDQMRADAMGCMGNPDARTPYLDAMANKGVLFENCFSNNPVRIPSRMSIFSGRYPHQLKRLANIPGQSASFLEFEHTLGAYFKEQGYSIGYIGENHTYEQDALNQFDVLSIRGREGFRTYDKYVQPFWHCDTVWPQQQCNPKKNTDEAIDFIASQNGKRPFFLHISYFDPHPPYMAPAEVANTYQAKDMILPEYIDPNKLSKRLANQQKALNYNNISDAELDDF